MNNKYVSYEIYKTPDKPTEHGKYIGKTPILEQAQVAVENAKAEGKSYFIMGVNERGEKVLFL